jgi:hypothetical protein
MSFEEEVAVDEVDEVVRKGPDKMARVIGHIYLTLIYDLFE